MTDLEVQLGGLRALAGRSDAAAETLAGGVGPRDDCPAHQPSGAAVSAVQAAVEAMAGRLSTRAAASAVKVDDAATSFGEQERDSAARIAATRPTTYR
ncbi:hypothetical protein MCHIJ_19360 [Mycolicibacterium chitae]|uniref:Uncharacterized protein n=1 Tax=Mycolicibacterium chitae TaxID=1792 RepID=A0A3S4RCG8_MYCCI|nr:hypothetical protein [Mycolicibacterium chitae]MCV7106594.1 hypothetical protein [Mycolicibacterium chitae]BBZ02499.1 hypothetical protein MCHIJ_19360 [Mycolicibacterium chitae]VEG45120.1 Uncharacterised protein [Mycolicibacterium chitae]